MEIQQTVGLSSSVGHALQGGSSADPVDEVSVTLKAALQPFAREA